MSRLLPPARKRSLTTLSCAQGVHTWKATLFTGEFLCLVCGARGVCPSCLPHEARTTAHLVACAIHRPKEVLP
jgi:hypothetical protein